MTKKTNESTAIAVAETAELVAVPTVDVDLAQEDMMIPFLKVIQSLSEEVMPGKDKYNADVRPGDIYDSVTKTIFTDSKVVICGLKKYYAEWTPEVRGKLVAKHLPTSDIVKNAVKVEVPTEKGNTFYQLKTATGNDLVETFGVLMIVKTPDDLVLPGILTLSKTSFMVGKQLSTQLMIHKTKGTPVFKIGTVSSSNTKGSWFKPSFVYDSIETDTNIIDMARSMAAAAENILINRSESDGAAEDNDLL